MGIRLSGVVAGVLLVASLAAWAARPENLIKYRQDVMKSLGGQVAASFLLISGKVEHPDELKIHADAIGATAPLLRHLFPRDSASGKTQALPATWEQPDKFAAAVRRLETAAANFQRTVDNHGDSVGALKELGTACKNCPKSFREKTQ